MISNIPTLQSKTLICWKMFPSRHIWVCPPISHLFPLFLVNGALSQLEQIPLLRQSGLSFWRWSAILRRRRRLKQKLTMSSTEDFRNIAIFFPFPTSRPLLKKFIGMLQRVVCFKNLFLNAKRVSAYSRWEPVAPLGRPLFLPIMMVINWHPCLVKASRICRPAMISTMTIISPPTLLWSPTNGDKHFPLFIFEFS